MQPVGPAMLEATKAGGGKFQASETATITGVLLRRDLNGSIVQDAQHVHTWPRAALAVILGTIHGFGFATALSALLLDTNDFAVALDGGTKHVASGRLSIGQWIVRVGSVSAALIRATWLWQRLPALVRLG
jgi:hypothetical protein